MNIKFDHTQENIGLGMGISEERREQILKMLIDKADVTEDTLRFIDSICSDEQLTDGEKIYMVYRLGVNVHAFALKKVISSLGK